MNDYENGWLTVRAAALYCDLRTPRQIYAAIREGALPAYDRGGRGGIRIRKDDLDAWLMGRALFVNDECARPRSIHVTRKRSI
jgi:excisionase family DNA binding protein